MAKFGAPAILSLVVLVVGILFYILAVAGVLFAEPTEPTDIGVWSVTIVFVALGALGIWASFAEAKQKGRA